MECKLYIIRTSTEESTYEGLPGKYLAEGTAELCIVPTVIM